ncbi:esterase-like activity of phytase family protein [Maritalea mediterranea]|uniref:Esterase-like activity of phytase family protein n=1 Tax=Maritalea mediterranea TaxID=2909667 RepID=A0ABS9EAX4_9HYPH|nr:esterase-like activity of phytase family protein [Maritalea mediterranea]MCF4098910.1 esterase-like activity of phytase family protein [Maritalea mediterranea]
MSLFKTISLAALSSVSLGSMAALASPYFDRVNSFPVAQNAPEAEETSAEIIAANADGSWLVYSDSPAGGLGFIGLFEDGSTTAKGFVALDGEPTSVAVIGEQVFAGVNTSESYTAPSGHVAVINAASQEIVATCDLGGQPDSIAASKDGAMLAVAIENERDEDLNDGVLPQAPAGFVALFKVAEGALDCDSQIKVDLTGLAEVGASDPEPEFVDFNMAGELVVTLQENNHLVVLDGVTGEVKNHFSAGAVDLVNVDTEEERALTFDGTLSAVVREPDAVKWLDNDRFVTANEGDYEGGSRGFTIWNKDGSIVWDSGMSVDHLVARLGHYPEKRSDNKGSEPEGLEVAKFGADTLIFVLLERASLVLVYKDTGGEPEFIQALPSGIAPEGAVAISAKDLLVTANEKDLREDGGPGSHVMVYARTAQTPAYPQIISKMDGDRPIGWTALSGLVADAEVAGKLYAVNDSFLRAQPSIYEIDATQSPAKIVRRIGVTRDGAPAQKLDLEGITLDGDGGFWLASEGRTDRLTPHALYHVNAEGEIEKEVPFPAELLAVEKRFGAEGITAVGEGDEMVLWIAIQREWADDDKGEVKLVSYTPATGEWGAVHYPLDQGEKGWVGLSEITAYGDMIYVVERDNQLAANAKIKKLYAISVDQMQAAPLGSELPLVEKTEVHDFLPDMKALNGFVLDKIESFAIDAAGEGFAMTDNDGVDDHSGETLFFSIGKM